MRTILTILGMGVGIGAVLFLVSLGYGLQRVILSQITTTDSLLSLDVSPGGSGLVELNDQSLDSIRQIPFVEKVSPVVSQPGQVTVSDISGDILVYAIDPDFFRLNGTTVDFGNNFDSFDARQVVISSIAAQAYDFEDPSTMIGQDVAIGIFVTIQEDDEVEEVKLVELTTTYRVVGIIDDETASYIYLPLDTIKDVNLGTYSLAKVKVSAEQYLGQARDQIISQGLIVSALSDTIDQAKKIFRIVQIVLGLFGLIALIVSAIGMFNTMTITLLEKINEIGIMRSLGITRGDIQKIFIFEAISIGFLGGLSGIIIGFLSGELVNLVLNILAKNFGGRALDVFYSPMWFILFILGFSTFIGMITGLYPARRAGRLNPLSALRYK